MVHLSWKIIHQVADMYNLRIRNIWHIWIKPIYLTHLRFTKKCCKI